MVALHEWVRSQAQRAPNQPAIVAGSRVVTYGELEAGSNQVAHALRAVGVRPRDRVAMLLPKGERAYAAMLGIQKAGAAYVPLDPENPAPRLAAMLRSAEPRVLLLSGIAAKQCADAWPQLNGCQPSLVWADDDETPCERPTMPVFGWDDLEALPVTAPHVHVTDDSPVYLMYTSGSTGTPKGVVITHANVRPFIEWCVRYFGITQDDRLSAHAPLHFDLSTLDFYAALASGATLYPVPPTLNLFPERLAEFIRGRRLTQWFSAPSVLNYLASFDVVRRGDFPELRRVLWCGEVLPTPALRSWMVRLPHARFTNLYGPTEATVASSYYTVPACPEDDAEQIPIGRPCAGERLVVLDEAGRPAAPDTVGELHIGGVGLSPGYWRDEAKTRAAFIRDPARPDERLYRTGDLARVGADGLVYFLGRRDTQIKSRGHRIELGEIETALLADPGVRECAVVGVSAGGFDGQRICCAYAVAPGCEASPTELRRRLAHRVPKYMIPAEWHRFEHLPKNANGKTDRRAIREMFATHATVSA